MDGRPRPGIGFYCRRRGPDPDPNPLRQFRGHISSMLHTPDAELYVGSRIAQIERKHFGRWFGKHALHRTHHFDQGGFQALHVVYRSRTKVIFPAPAAKGGIDDYRVREQVGVGDYDALKGTGGQGPEYLKRSELKETPRDPFSAI